MNPVRRRPSKRLAWLVGLGVMAALAVSLSHLWKKHTQRRASLVPATAAGSAPVAPKPGVQAPTRPASPAMLRRIGGIVRLPGGQPAAGASVAILRARTAWPEWRAEPLDQQAITGPDGTFEFRLAEAHGLLLDFAHPAFAGGLEEVPAQRDELELRLQPGFELEGIVLNDAGAPLGNARVAIESVLADQRRARAVTTSANGRYRFTNVPAGPVRLVARHEWWQPEVAPVVVIGETARIDLRFDRPAMAPLRGRVVSAASQAPIAGATVELMAPNSKLGLVDPVAVTTGPDGSFLSSGLPRGNLRVLVRHERHGAVARTLAVGPATAEQLFELPGRSKVRGQLVVDAGNALPWRGQVLQIRDLAGQLDHAVVDAEGRFAFGSPLSPGWATVTALGGAMAFQRSLARETAVRIDETAETQVELVCVPPSIVRGRLVDERGQPLAGGSVHQTKVLAENARWIGDAAVALDLGSVGSQVAQLVTYDRDELLAVSAADGSFEFRGQKPGLMLVRFDLPRRGGRWLRIAVPSGDRPVDLGAVVMPRGCAIQGRVLRGDRPLAGAAVTVVGRESQAVAVTRGDGGFLVEDLQPGEYRLRARLPSLATGSIERIVTTTGEGAPPRVDLVLPMGRTVRGFVSGSDGQPVPSALVTVRGAVGQPTLTDPAGNFLLELPERAVELQVSLGDRSRQSVVPVVLGQQQVDVRLDTPPTCTLVAQVRGLPGKKQLPGALVRFTQLDGGAEGETKTRWIDMQKGELRWPLCPVGRVRVQVWCDGYAPFLVERDFAPNDEQTLGEVLLEPGSRLQGRVLDRAGEPVANATVILGEETDLDLYEPRVRSGDDGTFRISGVTNRSSRLVVRATGFAVQVLDLQLPRDVLAAEPLAVVLAPGSTIEVVAARGAREAGLVQLLRDGRVVATAEFDDAGRAVFGNRSPGEYGVAVFGSEEAPVTVRVEGSGRVFRVPLQ